MLLQLCYEYLKNELNWSALLLAQDLQQTDDSYDINFIILTAMLRLNLLPEILSIIEGNKSLLGHSEIRLIFIKAGGKLNELKEIEDLIEDEKFLSFEKTDLYNYDDKNDTFNDGLYDDNKNDDSFNDNKNHDLYDDQKNDDLYKDHKNNFTENNQNIHFTENNHKNNFTENNHKIQNNNFIKNSSLELFFHALNKPNSIRKKLILKSFYDCTLNVEAIIFLFKESLCTFRKILQLIDQIKNQKLKESLSRIFSFNIIYRHPLQMLINLHFQKNYEFLLNDSLHTKERFLENEFIYFFMGLGSFVNNGFLEAGVAFKSALELNNQFGMAHLYMGVIQSQNLEMEAAIKSYSRAYSIMEDSFIPAYYIAIEYQAMNNVTKCNFYYENALRKIELSKLSCEKNFSDSKNLNCENLSDSKNISKNLTDSNLICKNPFIEQYNSIWDSNSSFVINSFTYFLIYNEEYDSAQNLIFKYKIDDLLIIFFNLFTGEIGKAEDLILSSKDFLLIDKNNDLRYNDFQGNYSQDNYFQSDIWKSLFYATRAYINHIKDNFDNSILDYKKSLSLKRSAVVVELLNNAIENKAGVPNTAFDYGNALFESLPYKNKRIPMIE